MSDSSAKNLVRRFLASKKEASSNDAQILLDAMFDQFGARSKTVGDGAEASFKIDWMDFKVVMDKEGKYKLSVSGDVTGKIPYMPYEDYYDMAGDLMRGDTHFSLFRRL